MNFKNSKSLLSLTFLFCRICALIDDEYLREGWIFNLATRFNVKRLLNPVQNERRHPLLCCIIFRRNWRNGVVCRCLDEDLFTRADNTCAFLSRSSFVRIINFGRRKRIELISHKRNRTV